MSSPYDSNTPETPGRESAPLDQEVRHELHQEEVQVDPYQVLRRPDYRRYLIGGVFAAAGTQMTNVAAGWELYDRTSMPFSLGLLGLMSALPVIFLALPAGTLADRRDRRGIVLKCEAGSALCLAALALVSWFKLPLYCFYALVLLNAVCGAFVGPALQALAIGLVEPNEVASATKWGSIRWQVAATFGPVVGGFLISFWGHTAPIYGLDALGRLLFLVCLWPIRPRPQVFSREALNWSSVSAGWSFIKVQPLIISTITMDMVAVLFGGATALLPVYAKELLHVGPAGLGPLRAAPAVGAIVMGLFLTVRPPMRRAGLSLLWAVAGFGLATIVFGLSPLLPHGTGYGVALAALCVLGALDNVSVVVRHTLLQVLTPDSMRGRVTAVNSVFIGTSNEIGELESGIAAQLLGAIPAVVAGGAITVLIVLGVTRLWPQVARLGRLEDVEAIAI